MNSIQKSNRERLLFCLGVYDEKSFLGLVIIYLVLLKFVLIENS